MKVLIDINHPAHVHFFKNVIIRLFDEDVEIVVVASKKPMVYELLEGLGIDFIRIGTYGSSLVKKVIMLFWLNIKMVKICLRTKPDLIIGISSIRGSQIGMLLGIRTFIFSDTEHATEQIALYYHTASRVYTPFCFTKKLGTKQLYYQSIHEMSYLHKGNYAPDIRIFDQLGISPHDDYFVLRFVAWDATHDVGQKGISQESKARLISYLENFGRVFVSTEGKPEDKYRKYEFDIDPWMLHHVLYYAKMYVGEGATMAVEASILGTPSIYVNSLQMGYTSMLENKYEILKCLETDSDLLEAVELVINKKQTVESKSSIRTKISEDLFNTADYIVSEIINNAS